MSRQAVRDRPPGPALFVAVLGALLAARCPAGEASPPGVREVVLKSAATADGLGERAIHRRYRVEQADGDWLWIATAAGSPVGWVRADETLPPAEAVRYFTRQIRNDPDAAWAYHRRALAWLDRHEPDIAIADYTDAIRLDPSDALARANRGLAWLDKAEYGKAIADFDAAIRLDPSDAPAHDHRGLARAARRETDRAIADFDAAVRLDPSDAQPYAHRGREHTRARRYDRALADYNEAVRLDPADPSAQNALAWLVATCPAAATRDAPRAVALATRANELTRWENPYYLGTLAAAEAEAGHFDAAVRWQSRALSRFAADDPDLPGHRARLALYRARKPYHEGRPQS